MALTNQLQSIQATLASTQTSLSAFESRGVKAESTRARNGLMTASKQIAVLRKAILDFKKAMPVRKRSAKEKTDSNDVPPAEIPDMPVLKRETTEDYTNHVAVPKKRGRKPRSDAVKGLCPL